MPGARGFALQEQISGVIPPSTHAKPALPPPPPDIGGKKKKKKRKKFLGLF